MLKNLITKYVIKMVGEALEGKKTYIGAVTLLLMGVGKICFGLVAAVSNVYPDLSATVGVSDPVSLDTAWVSLQEGATFFGAGMVGLGLRHKLQRGESK